MPENAKNPTISTYISTYNSLFYQSNNSLAERKRQAELNRIRRDFQVFPWGKPEWIKCGKFIIPGEAHFHVDTSKDTY